MTTIGLVANDQSLEVAVNPVITSGEENTVTLHVDFSEDWNGFGKTAVFFTEKNKNTLYEKVMTSGECIVPSEVMVNEGAFLVGIRGVNSTSKQVKTTSLVKYKILQGTPAVIEFEPTPDVYEQLLGSYGKLESDIAVERARIDNLSTLTEGSTTADAELLDIRVKADGTTATSAGDAVREQVSELKGELSNKLPKSPANWGPWTAEEQAVAREKIVADGGEMELIAEVTTTEELDVISVSNFPDGTQLKLKSFMAYFVIPKASSDGFINSGYKINYGNNLSINRDSANSLIKSGFDTHNNMYVLWNNARPIGLVTKYATWVNGSSEIESVVKYDNHLDSNANYISEVHLSKYANGIKIPSGTRLKVYGVRA